METIITDPEEKYILKVPTHGTGRISKKTCSIASPTICSVLTDELGSCTRIDVLKKRLKTHFFQCSLFILVFSQFSGTILFCYCRHICFNCYYISVNTPD